MDSDRPEPQHGDGADDSPPAPAGEPKPLPGLVAFAGMGMTIAVTVGAGVVLGLLGDAALHTSPALLIVGLVLGVAAATGAVVSMVKRYL